MKKHIKFIQTTWIIGLFKPTFPIHSPFVSLRLTFVESTFPISVLLCSKITPCRILNSHPLQKYYIPEYKIKLTHQSSKQKNNDPKINHYQKCQFGSSQKDKWTMGAIFEENCIACFAWHKHVSSLSHLRLRSEFICVFLLIIAEP